MNDDNKMTPTERRAITGLGTVFSLRMLGMFMVLPVLTTYGMNLQGASETLIGVAIGIYGLMQALFQIPFGLLSDRIGRKPIILGGLLIFVAGSLLAATTGTIWGVIAGRALQGAGAISAAIMALLSDLTREQQRTKAMALIGVSFGISFAIAMITGPLIAHHFGLHALFWLIALLASLGLIITFFFVPTPARHILNRESGMVRGSFRQVLQNRQLLKLNAGIFSLHLLLMSTFVVFPRQLENTTLLPDDDWKVYLFTLVIAFVAIIPVIIYAEKKRHMKQVFLVSIVLLLITEIILWGAGAHLCTLLAGLQCFFLGFNVMEAILPSWISKEAPAGYKGTAMGVYSTCQFLGVAAGGGLSGWLYDHYGSDMVFILGVLVALCWLLLSSTLKEPPYVSSLRLPLPAALHAWPAEQLRQRLLTLNGVTDALVDETEHYAYIKYDSQQVQRDAIERHLQTVNS